MESTYKRKTSKPTPGARTAMAKLAITSPRTFWTTKPAEKLSVWSKLMNDIWNSCLDPEGQRIVPWSKWTTPAERKQAKEKRSKHKKRSYIELMIYMNSTGRHSLLLIELRATLAMANRQYLIHAAIEFPSKSSTMMSSMVLFRYVVALAATSSLFSTPMHNKLSKQIIAASWMTQSSCRRPIICPLSPNISAAGMFEIYFSQLRLMERMKAGCGLEVQLPLIPVM